MGLVEARVVGARAGEGDVIVILDAHCECVSSMFPSDSNFLNTMSFSGHKLVTTITYSDSIES